MWYNAHYGDFSYAAQAPKSAPPEPHIFNEILRTEPKAKPKPLARPKDPRYEFQHVYVDPMTYTQKAKAREERIEKMNVFALGALGCVLLSLLFVLIEQTSLEMDGVIVNTRNKEGNKK